MTHYEISLDTPIGKLQLVATDEALVGLYLPEHCPAPAPAGPARDGERLPVLERTRDQLTEYFAGKRQSFDLPLGPSGTEFQRQVWGALRAIPFGATRSYAELAADLGRPTATRAVGAANARNPISIIVPCHRVVGADGSLTGYAGGLARKEWLLRHEKAAPDAGG